MTSRIRVFIGEPSSIDPANGFEHDGALLLRFLADPLVDYTPDGAQPRPAAASAWRVDPDGLRVVFDLREDVRFHHGRPVTAADYVYSLSRVARPETGSKLAYHLAIVDGYEAVRAGQARSLRGVRALGPYRLEVRLVKPFHEIATVFGHRVTAPVPAELCETDPESFARCPVSNGPYRIDRAWVPGEGVTLARFAGYYGANQAWPGGGAGHLDRLEFRIVEQLDDAFERWQRGELDVTKVPPARIPEAFRYGESFRRTPCALMQYIGFPTRVPPFDDPLVRRAVAMSVDRQHIIDTEFHGTRPIANRILPPTLTGPDARDLVGIEYDPAAARKLLAERGVADGLRLDFAFNAGLGHDRWVTSAVGMLNENLGWRVTPKPLPWPQFLRWLGTADSLFRMTWAIDYPSADNFLHPLFHSTSVGRDNYTGFADERVDELIDRARATADDAERAELYRSVEAIACQQLPLFPLWFGVQYHLVRLDDFTVDGPPVDVFGEPTLRLYRPRG